MQSRVVTGHSCLFTLTGIGRGILLKDEAEIVEVHALAQKVDTIEKDLAALKSSVGM